MDCIFQKKLSVPILAILNKLKFLTQNSIGIPMLALKLKQILIQTHCNPCPHIHQIIIF